MMNISKYNRGAFFALIIIALWIVSCSLDNPVPQATPEIDQQIFPTHEPTSTPEPQSTPHFMIQPESSLADEAIKIEVLGLEPKQEITLIASIHDGVDKKWQSHATFMADQEGFVDVALQAPITGTYTTVDPMGLFWSMVPQVVVGSEMPYFAALGTPFALVNLVAESNGEDIATAHIRRIIRAKNVTQSTVTENGLVGEFYSPNAAGKVPALIILGGSDGGMSTQMATLLASHGYATLALAYFGIPPLPSSLTEIPLEYFQIALDWLQTQDNVDADKIGVIGTSRGGELALLLGSTYPEIKAVVGYVGSGIVFGNLSRDHAGEKSAWTYQGEPIPFLNSTQDNLDEATIPVEHIQGAILLISSEDDQIWPSALLSEVAITRLKENHHSYPFEHLAYVDAGHHIGKPYWPTSGNVGIHRVSGAKYSSGGTPAGTAFASSDSWVKLLEFLETNLRNIND